MMGLLQSNSFYRTVDETKMVCFLLFILYQPYTIFPAIASVFMKRSFAIYRYHNISEILHQNENHPVYVDDKILAIFIQ